MIAIIISCVSLAISIYTYLTRVRFKYADKAIIIYGKKGEKLIEAEKL